MAGSCSPKQSLSAYIEWLQHTYQLTDKQLADMLHEQYVHYNLLGVFFSYGQSEAACDGKVAGTESA